MKKTFIIGLCVVIAMFILFFGIEFLKGVNIFSSTNSYYAVYNDIEGLQTSAPVEVNGFKVGQVNTITYEYDNPGHVRVTFSLDKHLKVPEGTEAAISISLLGTASVQLTMGTSDQLLPAGSELKAAVKPGMMSKVANEVIPGFNNLVPDVDTLVNNVNGLVTDPSLLAAVQRLDAISASLANTMSAIDKTVNAVPALLANINKVTADLQAISSNLADFSGTLNEMPLDSTMNNILQVAENINRFTSSLNSTDSSLGQLLNDNELYDNLNNVATSLDSLLRDIKKNPKRYISIKLL